MKYLVPTYLFFKRSRFARRQTAPLFSSTMVAGVPGGTNPPTFNIQRGGLAPQWQVCCSHDLFISQQAACLDASQAREIYGEVSAQD